MINLVARYLVRRIFGHVRHDTSLSTVGIAVCTRCLCLVERRTIRRGVTRGDIERRMAANPPEGYSFVSRDWKKRKARFVRPSGLSTFASF